MEHWNYSGLPPVERYNAAVDRANELLAMLKAARDVLVGYQKHAGYLPEQGGYSTRMTEAEHQLARAVSDLDAVIAKATVNANDVVTDIRRGLKRWVQSNKHGSAEGAKATVKP
jgi:hypothetical protein